MIVTSLVNHRFTKDTGYQRFTKDTVYKTRIIEHSAFNEIGILMTVDTVWSSGDESLEMLS